MVETRSHRRKSLADTNDVTKTELRHLTAADVSVPLNQELPAPEELIVYYTNQLAEQKATRTKNAFARVQYGLWLAWKHLVEAIGLSIVTRWESALVTLVIVLFLCGLAMGLNVVFRVATGIDIPPTVRQLVYTTVTRVHATLSSR